MLSIFACSSLPLVLSPFVVGRYRDEEDGVLVPLEAEAEQQGELAAL